jgi:hypothetical protein
LSDVPPIQFQIIFVSPNGKEKLGPLIVPKGDQAPPKFDEDNSDHDRCARELPRLIRREDGYGVEAAMRAMDRLDCWQDSFRRLMDLAAPGGEFGQGLLRFWVVVLQIEAGPEIIICARPAHSQHLGEDKYLAAARTQGKRAQHGKTQSVVRSGMTGPTGRP